MTTKRAADLQPGDVVDLTRLMVYRIPLRTVASVDRHEHGIPEQAVVVTWVEDVGHSNTIRADKELEVR